LKGIYLPKSQEAIPYDPKKCDGYATLRSKPRHSKKNSNQILLKKTNGYILDSTSLKNHITTYKSNSYARINMHSKISNRRLFAKNQI